MTESTDRAMSDEDREKREERARIVGLDVVEVSLVDKAANEREFLVVKNLTGGAMNPEATQEPLVDSEVIKAALTAAERNELSDSDFALPEERRYPIPDISHARNALARVAQHGTDEEKKKVRAAVFRKFPSLKPKSESAEKALDLTRQLLKEKAEVVVMLVGKLVDGTISDDEFDVFQDATYKLRRGQEIMNLADGAAKCDTLTEKKEEADVTTETKTTEETTEETTKGQEAAEETKTESTGGDTSEEATEATAAEAEAEAEEEATDGKSEEAEAESAADGAADGETEEAAEKRATSVASLVKELKKQRDDLIGTIDRVEKFLGKTEEGDDEKTEEASKAAETEEVTALKALVESQRKELDGVKAKLDEIVKTRGTSKAADEPATPADEDRSKSDKGMWDNIL